MLRHDGKFFTFRKLMSETPFIRRDYFSTKRRETFWASQYKTSPYNISFLLTFSRTWREPIRRKVSLRLQTPQAVSLDVVSLSRRVIVYRCH